MEEVKNQLSQLLIKSEWTEKEKEWLLEYLRNNESKELQELMRQQFENNLDNTGIIDVQTSFKILNGIHEAIADKKHAARSILKMWATRLAAASFIGLLFISFYLSNKNDRINPKNDIAKTERNNKSAKKDIPPGSNKAVLTLADGSTIMLDDVRNGLLAEQGNTIVLKLDGKLTYKVSKPGTANLLYNKVSTPRGGQYQVVLPDNSRVWLNAGSSLYFPTVFKGKERRVEITGEAYFEVAKKADMPFIVKVKNAEVQVLGTHFNVMAYDQELVMKTTLLEGSVRFLNGNTSNILKPGQETQLSKNGHLKVKNNVDVSKVVAWKNGFFHFEKADIQTVMRQLSLWYDVDVVYTNNQIQDLFYADIPKNTTLSDVLKALEVTSKVQFEIEENRIIVR